MLLTILHLCDSLFPLGGFAHSDGLEAATASDRVRTADDLRAWMDVCLDESLARTDGPGVLRAWRAFRERRLDDVAALDAELFALRVSASSRSASRAMGSRLLRTWLEIHEQEFVDLRHAFTAPAFTLPVAFGVVCAAADVPARAALEGFIYTRLAATVSAAMRLMPIGQHEAHALLARTLTRAPATADRIEEMVSRGDAPGAFTPLMDLAVMEQPHLASRLFLS
jgi:urease accessory protein